MSGKIWISRDLWQDTRFRDGPVSQREAWLRLVSDASWRPRLRRLGDVEAMTERGQLLVSLRYLAQAWKWNESKVRRFLDKLQSRQMIRRTTDAGMTLITVCNYEEIQSLQPDTDTASTQGEARHRLVASAKEKKVKPLEKEEEGACAREADLPEPDRPADPAPAPPSPTLAAVLAAVGLTPATAPRYWHGPAAEAHVAKWVSDLGLTEADIVAEARASRAKNPEPPDGPKALDRWMQQAATARASATTLAMAKPTAAPKAPAKPEDRIAFFADLINSGRYVPVSAVSVQMARALVDGGHVKPERLRELGIAH